MKRLVHTAIVSVIAAQVLVIGQGNDVTRVLSELRQALGGAERLLSVKTLSAEGTITRSLSDGTARANGYGYSLWEFSVYGTGTERTTVNNLPTGSHTWRVRATDGASNTTLSNGPLSFTKQ